MKTRKDRPWTSLHLCGGSGGGGLGALRAGMPGKSIDIDPSACRNYEMLTGQQAECADITKMGPGDLRDYHGADPPDVALTSAPCKGWSRAMGRKKARTKKYIDLNNVALYTVHLMLEAWIDDPIPLILFENVPGMCTAENRPMLERIVKLLQAYGYSVDMRVHNCGEIGGLGQNRTRVLLAARHMGKVPNFLRLPPLKRVRSIGEVIGCLPVPTHDSTEGGPMHRLPRLAPKTLARLAAIRAGFDWRDLPDTLRLKPRATRHNGGFGVNDWNSASHTILAEGTVRNGWASVADPRIRCKPRAGAYGVAPWDAPSNTILAHHRHDNTVGSVADPRDGWPEPTHVMTERFEDGRRVVELEGPPFDMESNDGCEMVILAPDGTNHRPLTTLEMAVLQGFPARNERTGEWLVLDGKSHARWRQAIGDAIPVDAAEAIFRECIATLTDARDGRWTLDSGAIWTREEALAA